MKTAVAITPVRDEVAIEMVTEKTRAVETF